MASATVTSMRRALVPTSRGNLQRYIVGYDGLCMFFFDNYYGRSFPDRADETIAKGHRFRCLICIGGLTDGLLSCPVDADLAVHPALAHWNVVQVILRSSYVGSGARSLDTDVEDLDAAIAHILPQVGFEPSEVYPDASNAPKFALIGHSTGCQDVIHYMKKGKYRAWVVAGVLQAPVSDRECAQTLPAESRAKIAPAIEYAKRMVEDGNGNDWVPHSISKDVFIPTYPITATRLLSLFTKEGVDDMFSSDLTDDELSERLGHVKAAVEKNNFRLCIAHAMQDQYVPDFVDVRALGKRLETATGGQAMFGPGDHSINEQKDRALFVDKCVSFLLGAGIHPDSFSDFLVSRVSETIKLKQRNSSKPDCRPCIIGIAGIPGSGKTTSAQNLQTRMGDDTICLSMDGFHYPLEWLRRQDDSTLVYRRGAPDTFDVQSFLAALASLRDSSLEEILWPNFDHAVGDPKGYCRFLRSKHRCVIVDGLYLLSDDGLWKEVKSYLDACFYLHLDLETAQTSLEVRNQMIPGYSKEQIIERVAAVDMSNAKTVLLSAGYADLILPSPVAYLDAGRPIWPNKTWGT